VLHELQRTRGATPFPSDANFILFRVDAAEAVFSGLRQRGVLIKNVHGAHAALENCLRKRDRDLRLSNRFASLAKTHQHPLLACAFDDSVEFGAATVEHSNRSARFQPQDTSEMLCLLGRQRHHIICVRGAGSVESRIHSAIMRRAAPTTERRIAPTAGGPIAPTRVRQIAPV